MITTTLSQGASVVSLTRTEDDVADLLKAVRAYMVHEYPQDVSSLSPGDVLRTYCESTRITTRLTCAMNWMALQQAARKGQLKHEDIAIKHLQLPTRLEYLDYHSQNDPKLPVRLRELLQRSHDLYVRVIRLYGGAQDVHQPPQFSV